MAPRAGLESKGDQPMWTRFQRRRLACERKVLERKLPQFHFYNPTGDTYVSGIVPLRSAGLSLTVKCVLDPLFPDVMPPLYVTSPLTLWRYRRRGTVNSEGASHAFHTLWNGPGADLPLQAAAMALGTIPVRCLHERAVVVAGVRGAPALRQAPL